MGNQGRRPNNRQNNRQNNRGQFGRNGVTRNGAKDSRGTEVYPGCSGKVCLPEAQLCAERKQKTGHEQIAVGRFMNSGNVREVWTSGRLCDKEVDGCEADRFQPYNIRGWFWASSLQSMGETNVFNGRKFNGWSSTGPLNKPQPDGILKADGFGEQACTALLDNFFNDGLTWHDTKCNDRRHIVCEDLPVGNINFVRQQNPGVNIP